MGLRSHCCFTVQLFFFQANCGSHLMGNAGCIWVLPQGRGSERDMGHHIRLMPAPKRFSPSADKKIQTAMKSLEDKCLQITSFTSGDQEIQTEMKMPLRPPPRVGLPVGLAPPPLRRRRETATKDIAVQTVVFTTLPPMPTRPPPPLPPTTATAGSDTDRSSGLHRSSIPDVEYDQMD